MRICLVSHSFFPATFYGGPISATWGLSKKIANNNVYVYVSTTNANGNVKLDVLTNRYIQKDDNLFVKYYNEQIIHKFSFSFLLGIWTDIKKSDLIYIQYLFHYTVFLALISSLIQNKRIIICPRGSFSTFTLNNRFIYIKSFWLRFFIKPFANKVSWHASSYLEVKDIRNHLPKTKIMEVNDGIDFESFQNAKKIDKCDLVKKFTKIRFDKVSEVIFSMGRLHKIKRFDILIDAFCLYKQENKKAKLLIAGGDDGAKKELSIQIKELKLEDSVFLIGMVDFKEKKELLSNCSVFCLASEFESFGIVIAEALACGTPVIVSNKTPWELVKNKKIGIFAKNKIRSFSQSLKQIETLNFLPSNCRSFVRDFLDWEIVSKTFIKSFLIEK